MTLANGERLPGIRKVVVIGGGAAGLFAACLLDGTYDVTLIEKEADVGGHARSVTVPDGPDAGTRLDVGFINCAHSAYPRLFGYFKQLGIETAISDSSFCVFSENTKAHYFFAVGAQGEAEAANAPDPRLFKYLNKLARFYARAAVDLGAGELRNLTVGDYCAKVGLSHDVIENFIIPVYASLWVMPPSDTLKLSAESIYTFYRRVGLPSFKDYDAHYVVGSSRTYVDALLRDYRGKMKLSCGVVNLARSDDGVELQYEDGAREQFDAAVVALHADRALQILDDPTETERALLGPWRYPQCRVVLHSDPAVIDPDQRYVAAYNYLARTNTEHRDQLTISYCLNRIMRLSAKAQYFMTLNPVTAIDPARILLDTHWSHAFFSVPAVATQARLAELQGTRRTFYCGSYFSCGSHEDAATSAEAACRSLGVRSMVKSWEAAT
jgi:predicted NAD/FAD-binding protein